MLACIVLAGALLPAQQAAWPQPRTFFIRPGVGVSELFVVNSRYQASLREFQRRYNLATSVVPKLTYRDRNGGETFDFFQFGLRFVVRNDTITQLVFLTSTTSINGAQSTIMTTRRIGVGMPESAVERAYQKPTQISPASGGQVWYYTCIGFDISGTTQTVRAIIVYSTPGRRCET